MPNTLSELIKSLMGARDGVLPSMQTFAPVDIEQIASKLRLDARARENGSLNQPTADGEIEDVAEGDILTQIEVFARKAEDDYLSQIELYDARIRGAVSSANQSTSIDAAGQRALADFNALKTVDFNQLHNAVQEVKGRQREFEDFRDANKLARLPNILSPRDLLFRRLVLAFCVVLESLLNGLFFAKGSETGIIGGVVQALVLSVLNVGVAWLCGKHGFPRLLHVQPSQKAIGVVASVFYLIWAPGLNLLVGHFRDLFVQNAAQVSVSDLLSRLWSAPYFLPADSQSLLLAALGMCLSVVSLIDALGMDDLYPGYGIVGRRRLDAIASYSDQKERCLDRLTQRRDSAIAEMLQAMKLIEDANYDLSLAVKGRTRLHNSYRSYLNHLASCYLRLMAQYREVNMRERSLPSPARFLSPPAVPGFLSDPESLGIADLEMEASSRVIARLEHFIKAVNQQFEESVHQYETVASLTNQLDISHANA